MLFSFRSLAINTIYVIIFAALLCLAFAFVYSLATPTVVSQPMPIADYLAARKICEDNGLEPNDVIAGSSGVTGVNCSTKSGGYVTVAPASSASR